jgi:hypothetical protein
MELPPATSPVDDVFRDYRALLALLPESAVTDRVSLDSHFRKLCVLASASYLETLMTFHMKDIFEDVGIARAEFIRRIAIDHKFFTWFNFEQAAPAGFFKRFGAECFERYLEAVGASEDFDTNGRSFMRLCTARNELVHGNLAHMESSLTPEECESAFRQAIQFPDAAARIIRG